MSSKSKYLEIYNWLKENNLTHEKMEMMVEKLRKVNSKLDQILLSGIHWSELNSFLLNSAIKEYDKNFNHYFLIIGQYYTEYPIGCCTHKGIEDVNCEEPNSIFIEITKEEYDAYFNCESNKKEALPENWKSRKGLSFKDALKMC